MHLLIKPSMNSVNSMYRTVTERFGNLGSERVHYMDTRAHTPDDDDMPLEA
jgi:hypothetical protein